MATASMRTMPNQVNRAKTVSRSRSRRTPRNIAAIDFGTKNCSLAYILAGDTGRGNDNTNKLPLNDNQTRVPTAILLDRDKRVIRFGAFAKEKYSELDAAEKENVYFFDGIKVNLARDKDVSKNVPVRALNGKDLPLVEVISQILSYLKRELLELMNRTGHQFTAEDFDWVVTVPAIWLASGKQMMREAAKMAGLCSEQNPDTLSLALEPESGAIYCHEKRKRGQIAYPTPNFDPKAPPTYSYIIVDIGGGTVDISAHKVLTTSNSISVQELHHPVGNAWGGLQVNAKFSDYLQKLVDDRKFTRYLHGNDPEVRVDNRFEIDELLNDTFERKKKRYCQLRGNEKEDVLVKLPDSFLNIYRGVMATNLEAQKKRLHAEGRDNEAVRLENTTLRIPPAKMSQFLQPAVTGITECVDELLGALTPLGHEIDTIYLVGGFGGSYFIYDLFKNRYGGAQRKIIVPPSPEFAIVEGAALAKANSRIVRSRRADATYGKSVARNFIGGFHDDRYREGDFCHHLFQTIVGVDEVIRPDTSFLATSRPLNRGQKVIHFEVFSSKRRADELWYTKDEGVVLIGDLELQLPKVGPLVVDREIEIFFDFSHTEIKVKARDKETQTEVKAVLDFLSAIPPDQQRKIRVHEDDGEEEGRAQGAEEEEEEEEEEEVQDHQPQE